MDRLNPVFLPPDHPQRLVLAGEVHARPPQPVSTPSRATYLAVLVEAEDRDREWVHVAALCARFGVAGPQVGEIQFSATIGEITLRWERHGEFSGYSFIAAGSGAAPFEAASTATLPPDWLAAIPGRTLVAARAELMALAESEPDMAVVAGYFGENIVVGAAIAEGAGCAFTDFRVDDEGFSRWVLMDRHFTPRQAGRMLQRLFEIEAYRMLALLALPIARAQSPLIVADEKALAALTEGIAREGGNEEVLLQDLTRLAAGVESGLAASQFRFGATSAYAELVQTRIAELRESRIPGIQTIDEFMARRFTPAVRTCATV
ncbi:MAG: DUF3422 domain-containing protein, partial [Burkholderiales bacterium]|nr:DUF3422 domain-containing protein [Burkholderiales bacterium]